MLEMAIGKLILIKDYYYEFKTVLVILPPWSSLIKQFALFQNFN